MDRDEMAAEAAKAANLPGEREKAIVAAWEKLQVVLTYKKEQSKRTKERIDGCVSRLREAVEMGTHVGDTVAQVEKLRAVELAWHGLEEAKSERVEVMKACKESVAAAEKTLRELIELSSQLTLFGS
jgi:hypothetical protein